MFVTLAKEDNIGREKRKEHYHPRYERVVYRNPPEHPVCLRYYQRTDLFCFQIRRITLAHFDHCAGVFGSLIRTIALRSIFRAGEKTWLFICIPTKTFIGISVCSGRLSISNIDKQMPLICIGPPPLKRNDNLSIIGLEWKGKFC